MPECYSRGRPNTLRFARKIAEKRCQSYLFGRTGFVDYFAAAPEIDAGGGALLVVDIKLPAGTPQGTSVALMTRNHRPGLPIIFVTGYPELAELNDSETGPTILKPIDLQALVGAVRVQLVISPIIQN